MKTYIEDPNKNKLGLLARGIVGCSLPVAILSK